MPSISSSTPMPRLALEGLRDAPARKARRRCEISRAMSRPRARNPRRSSRRRSVPTGSWPTRCEARVAQGRHPFVRDVTLVEQHLRQPLCAPRGAASRRPRARRRHRAGRCHGGRRGAGRRRRQRRSRCSATAAPWSISASLRPRSTSKADIVFVLMNDRGYGVIRNIQDAQFGGRRHYADLHTPDFKLVAAALGLAPSAGVAHRGFRAGARPRIGGARAATGRGRHGRDRSVRTSLCRPAGGRGGKRMNSVLAKLAQPLRRGEVEDLRGLTIDEPLELEDAALPHMSIFPARPSTLR